MLFNSSSRRLDQGNLNLSTNRSPNGRTRFFNFAKDYGDSLKDAENVGSIKRGKSYDYSGDVGGRDLDFFKFKLDRRGSFSATLNNKSDGNQPIALTVLNRQGKVVRNNGKFLFANTEAGNSQTLSVSGLAKGTYYVRLQSENGRDEDYDLKLSQSGSGTSTPGSNQSFNLGNLRPGDRLSQVGTVGGTSDIDFYSFSIDNTSRITARLSNTNLTSSSTADAIAFSILDSQRRTVQTGSGRFLFANVEGGDSETLLAPALSSGNYFVRVQSAEGSNEPYRLSLERSTLVVTPI
ncbi:T9SS type A sorting domain-containing protein [Leptolyngbya ohadii]|uniref:T9SS type A sorting domain-containing protein n=1 Tax=Leptolyngbya ohadii TaxID=1962290 RepID=UPI000B59EBAF|nr:T9SS type A sorting domain-containing protein [Leptolyngbya ohadii]